MSLNNYKISSELLGHSLDVRSVCEAPNSIVSGSRDKTAKIWNKFENTYVEGLTLVGHSNFISCVFYLEEENAVCTASNDSKIFIYKLGCITPLLELTGHSSTVCCLAKGFGPLKLVSGSWDKTAKIWDLNNPVSCITLEGHEAAVWAVTTIPSGKYITGSADKNIFIWNIQGEKVGVLKGHTDCVRGLVGLQNNGLLSCGNDAVIKLWNEEGELVRDFHGHSNYIYSISLHKDGDNFVTGSEDSTIRLWSIKSGALGDSLTLPAQSVWTVAMLNNGDIVTGTSDAVVRVFSAENERFAETEIQNAFTKAVETRKLEQAKELGGMKVNELPGPESLLKDGTEGQTKIVRQPDGKILCYQWTNNEWKCLGDVVGASGGTQASSGKKLFEGKEYDYVFDVDISDTDPPIKLPYNLGEDPWMAAQKFIHTNNLPQAYLDQVANFIIKNSDAVPVVSQHAGYVDPFTGESRYVPGSSEPINQVNMNYNPKTNQPGGLNLDPFTGGSSYSTGVGSGYAEKPSPIVKHFPFSTYQTLDVCDPLKVLVKLKEFNGKVDGILKADESVLENVIQLTNMNATPDAISIAALKNLLKWPTEILFPVLDITRLAVRQQNICSLLGTTEFLKVLTENLNTTPANQLMSVRCFGNMMSHGWGRGLIESELTEIISILNTIKKGSANLEIAISSFLLNLTISQVQLAEIEICRIITDGIIEFLKWSSDNESNYRVLQGIGNLSCTPGGQITLAQINSVEEIALKLKKFANQLEPIKLKECARDICDLMS